MEYFGMEAHIKEGSKVFIDNDKRYLIAFCDDCNSTEVFEQSSSVQYKANPQVPCDNCGSRNFMKVIGWQQENEKMYKM